MNQQERLAKILSILEKQPKISQKELMSIFNISKDSVRRDIVILVEQGLAERYPGGISRPLLKAQIENYSSRLIKRAREKEEIAKEAGHLLDSEMTIYLDVSTTVHFLAANLVAHDLVVVTNSMDNALSVSQEGSNQVYLLGGFFNAKSRILTGEAVLQQLNQFNFDWSFIGAAGITEQGIYYSELADSHLKRGIIQNSQKVCLLIDSSKFNQQSAYKIDFTGINKIITDQALPPSLMNVMIAKEIDVVLVKEGGK
ncbi:DeoR family transcriptional regulator [Listeria weihenstephanensis FSL R9-0317]|uniref:DeoR faimly transcriptional regulator n=1 Tax=Listeria weihenstephanensis TaxID=1006155 RepID=A0A1S7FUH4_9LIST|nr:DeoR/GlpR family DNA-binding transcription regulator [Listeria weihenstephanensis]AQY51042.1 DeoR faimly transcriptional regulator [Listeria weihenstephanensis]EUJ36460.1 DeoR family transcriptional regulator [Listeria weihenstephanensis FSL R9-0317]